MDETSRIQDLAPRRTQPLGGRTQMRIFEVGSDSLVPRLRVKQSCRRVAPSSLRHESHRVQPLLVPRLPPMSSMHVELERTEHPVDVVERIASINDWRFDREDDDEISISVG